MKRRRRIKVVGQVRPCLNQSDLSAPATRVVCIDLAPGGLSTAGHAVIINVDIAFHYASAELRLCADELPALVISGVTEKDAEAWGLLSSEMGYTDSKFSLPVRFNWLGNTFNLVNIQRVLESSEVDRGLPSHQTTPISPIAKYTLHLVGNGLFLVNS